MSWLIAERSFTVNDQERFARLSGDCNPLHMDAVAARRTLAGFPVVHGIHALLWALDALWMENPGLTAEGLRVRFEKMIHVGDRVRLMASDGEQGGLRFDILVDDSPAVRGRLTIAAPGDPPPSLATLPLLAPAQPRTLTFDEAATASGRIDILSALPEAAELFPAAAAGLDAVRVAWLAKSSFLVGMVSPGMHSIYNGLELAKTDIAPGAVQLYFSPKDNDSRFRLVRMRAWGGGWDGAVEAFVRPPPTAQPNIVRIGKLVARGEFSGAAALIVGGSRGLGEVAGKVLAAGGARVAITFRHGNADAQKVRDEIRAAGGACDLLSYDVLGNAQKQLASLPFLPNQLYFFATPAIFRRKGAVLTPGRFEEFAAFYVDGFYRLCRALRAQTSAEFVTFYPSSVSVDNRPANMTEYTMAKAAGEVLCADMQRFENAGPILVRRLPRLPTDQTATLAPVAAADPLDVLLPIIREMQGFRS
jgi:hypothetical protein